MTQPSETEDRIATREEPARPETQEEPAQPEARQAPAQPETREEPAQPEARQAPAQPETREEPAQPEARQAPTQPETRDEPARTETRDEPARTETRDEPDRQKSPAPAPRARRWYQLTLPGASVAVIFGCLAFTPSLLPRSGLTQGVVCGITGVIGYGLGVLGAAVWRAFANRDARRPAPRSWKIFGVVAVLALLASYLIGQRQQGEIRDLMGVPAPGFVSTLLWPVMAAVVFALILGVARGLRWLYRRLAHLLNRWIGPRAARGVGWLTVVGLTYALTSGVLLSGAVTFANKTFSVQDGITKPGAVQPISGLRSGGSGSLVSWQELGREGRSFTGTGPSAKDISAFTGRPAKEPIRAYAGLSAEDTTEKRARLAVDDLQRAGGFERAYLMVTTSTGSGWLDPSSVDTFEYLTGGDSAVVGIQYSYLPSWISYLVDQQKAREAGRELFDAVYDRWSRLAENRRPKLVVFGESLGSFGGETAFSGEYDMRNRTAGTLFVGPPNFNTLYRRFTDDRDSGSPEIEPVYRNGRTVRFESVPGAEVDPTGEPWDGSRVLYLQHPSDPIVWWSPNLLLSRPDWLTEPRGRDVVPEITWFPFITFWQISADLPLAAAVPGGHGHKYVTEYVDAWASVLRPPDWTSAKADQLRQLVAKDG